MMLPALPLLLCWFSIGASSLPPSPPPSEAAPPVSVAVLNVSALFRADASEEEIYVCASAIDRELSTLGAFVAVGVPVHELDALQAAKDLFATTPAALMDIKIQKDGFMRGYLPFGQESGLQTHFEPKEGFSYGYNWKHQKNKKGAEQGQGGRDEVEKANALHGDNIWPDSDSATAMSSRVVLEELFNAEIGVAERLTECISMALNGGNASALASFVDPLGSTSVMRLFHYFATDLLEETHGADVSASASGKTVMGSSPHTDWGYLTLILQDDVGGLQLMHRYQEDCSGSNDNSDSGSACSDEWVDEWIDVPYVSDSLIVNGGDFLSVLSGGRYVSPIHRVLSPTAKDRTSFVLFYYPRFDTPMDASLFKRTAATVDIDGNGGGGGQHNSLFSLVDSGGTEENDEEGSSGSSRRSRKCFGEYIIEKWREVKAY